MFIALVCKHYKYKKGKINSNINEVIIIKVMILFKEIRKTYLRILSSPYKNKMSLLVM